MISRVDSITLAAMLEPNKPVVWFDIKGSFFSIYIHEGVNPGDPDEDIIYYAVDSQNMCTALSSLKNAVENVEIKLAKETFPCFTIHLRIPTSSDESKATIVRNQVPVIIVPRSNWDEFRIPYNISYEIIGKLPRYQVLKRYIDIYKMSKKVVIRLRNDGHLLLKTTTDSGYVNTVFENVQATDVDLAPYKGRPISTTVETKQISQFLHSINHHQMPIVLTCMMKRNECFKIMFRLQDYIMGHFVISTEFDELVSDDEPEDQTSDNEMDSEDADETL